MALRYVILRHEGIEVPHFDLMFEIAPGAQLATWRSDAWPIFASTPLLRLRDHRRMFLDFEGALSGDRGVARRVEQGGFDHTIDPGGAWLITLFTDHGNWKLRLTPDPASGQNQWIASRGEA